MFTLPLEFVCKYLFVLWLFCHAGRNFSRHVLLCFRLLLVLRISSPKPHFLLYWKLTKPLNCKPVYRYSTKYFETTNTAINKRIKNQEAPFCLFAGMTDDLISVRLRNIGQRGTPTQDYLINSDASTVTRPRCRLKWRENERVGLQRWGTETLENFTIY